MFMDWSLILLLLAVWAPFLIKTNKDMEACTAAWAKAVEVDGVSVDSR